VTDLVHRTHPPLLDLLEDLVLAFELSLEEGRHAFTA
jgi:hypothetical protein